MSLKKILAAASGIALAATMAACSQESAGPTGGEGSGGSGSLTVVCGAQEDWCQAVTKAFTEKSGIQTDYVRLSSGETVARLGASKDSPEFDVWHGGPSDGFEAADEAGLIEHYTSDATAAIPDTYKSADGTWTGVYVGVLGFCSNSKVLDKIGAGAPESWADLVKPEFKKQVGTAHPATSGTAYTTLWTQMVLHDMDEAATFDYMRQLNNNVLQYSKSGTAPGQQAGRAEIATGLVFTHDCVKYYKEGMTDLVVTTPSEGTGYEVGGVGIIKNSQNLDAAKQYVDFAVSVEAQEIGPSVGSYQVPTNPDTPTTEDMLNLDEVTLIDYDSSAAGAMKADLVSKFDSEVATAPKS